MKMAIQWTIAEGAEGYLPGELLRDPEGYVKEYGEVILDGRRHLTALCNGHDVRLFVKIYRLKTIERLKALFRDSRAEREWKGARRLQEAGVSVPQPLAWGRGGKKAFYICQALENARSILEIGEGLRALLPEVARAIKAMHDAGVFHRDLHGDNVVIKGKPYLVDLHRHRYYRRGVPHRKRLWDVACFLYSIKEHLSWEDRDKFLGSYWGEESKKLFHQVEERERRVRLRHLEHVRQDCQKESESFKGIHLGKLCGWSVREITIAELEAILAKHRNVVRDKGPGLKKVSSRSLVTLFYLGKNRLCVKEYKFSTISGLKECFRLPKPRRAWINANVLKAKGIGGMIPLAYLEAWAAFSLRRAYLIVLSPENYVELSRYIKTLYDEGLQKKRRFIKAFAFFLSSLRKERIWHRDLKAHHVMVAEKANGWDFALIEPEDVRFFVNYDESKFVRNLVQLNTSLPPFVSWRDKARFLRDCFGSDGNFKRIFREVQKKSSKREVVYISP